MSKPLSLAAALVLAVSFPLFAEDAKPAPKLATAKSPAATDTKKTEPQHILIQHLLIGFKGSMLEHPIARSQEEAKKLAEEIFARAKKGEDFDALVKKYTDDAYPGKYGVANNGVTPDTTKHEYPRAVPVPALGDVGFSLAVGEIGFAPYDAKSSPHGWHIIKRLE